MPLRITKPEDALGINLPDDIKEMLAAELVPRGLPARKGPWTPVTLSHAMAEYQSAEFKFVRDLYNALLEDNPDLEKVREMLRARLRDISA